MPTMFPSFKKIAYTIICNYTHHFKQLLSSASPVIACGRFSACAILDETMIEMCGPCDRELLSIGFADRAS